MKYKLTRWYMGNIANVSIFPHYPSRKQLTEILKLKGIPVKTITVQTILNNGGVVLDTIETIQIEKIS